MKINSNIQALVAQNVLRTNEEKNSASTERPFTRAPVRRTMVSACAHRSEAKNTIKKANFFISGTKVLQKFDIYKFIPTQNQFDCDLRPL